MGDGVPATGGGWCRSIVAAVAIVGVVVIVVVVAVGHGGAKGRCPQ